MRWFSSLPDETDAVEKAKMLFQYVAESYLDNIPAPSPPLATASAASQPASAMLVKSSSFLASACLFTWPTARETTPMVQDPKAELNDEISHYIAFYKEVPPKNEEEIKEHLMNPLGWWKVSLYIV